MLVNENEYLIQLNNIKNNELVQIEQIINPQYLKKQVEELMEQLNKENWKNNENIALFNTYQHRLNQWNKIHSTLFNLFDIIQLNLQEEEVLFSLAEIDNEYQQLLNRINDFRIELMFNGKYDGHNVLLTIHAGAGGKEAQDWANMLLRMYSLWCSKKGFKCNIIDFQPGEDATICKSATIEIIGNNAYGLLKHEHGVHRLVRVSPFDSQGRRHTSFAAVEVLPELIQDIEICIDPKDIQIDTFRSSGAGGQHVNKTESAIRITHIPTGIVVACQNERSQYQNKEYAMKMLASKLLMIKEEEHLNEISEIQGEQKQIQWGSQIRSYVFMPYQMVKDHRSNWETGNVDSIINGNLDEIIYSNLIKTEVSNNE